MSNNLHVLLSYMRHKDKFLKRHRKKSGMVPISPMQCFATVKEKSQSASVNVNQKIVRYIPFEYAIHGTKCLGSQSRESRVCVVCDSMKTNATCDGFWSKR